jgi:hypothetical protein
MNPDTNEFYRGERQAENHIPFDLDEEITIKGHVFKVVTIDIPKNPAHPHLLVLTPVRKP